ncbi:DUF7927 domain-containing protein [Actinomadura hibisca]|uniref:DUF7927 domain-containing protein n=1 Tax=Actinomadura hibisca TaxID=68565 RepID=UPI001470CB80|nr:DUF11 domain-containing protein [Actinomadura hibisca]
MRLDVTKIPGLGQSGFSGAWGTGRTGASGGNQSVDYSDDPDGVGAYANLANPSGSTSGDAPTEAWDAVSDPNVLKVKLTPGGPDLLDIPALHTYARCQPPHAPQTQNFVTAPTVAGQAIKSGTTRISVAGNQLGLSGVADGDLTVTMKQIENVTPDVYAESRVEITITGVLRDSAGRQVYSGPLLKAVLGDVKARCGGNEDPPPPPVPGRVVVDKTVDKDTAQVGKKVHYRLRVSNVGETALTNATFTDDLSDVLHHGDLVGGFKAESGKVDFDSPKLTWTGALKPGASVDVTFTVVARRVGLMRNVVVWPPHPRPKPTPTPKPMGKDKTETRVVPKHAK